MNFDETASARFDHRIKSAATALLLFHLIAIVVTVLLDQAVYTALLHGIMLSMTWVMLRTERDMVTFIIFSHVYWTFSFLTYFYALGQAQIPSYGIGDPGRAAEIGAVSLAGCFAAFLLSPRSRTLPAARVKLYSSRMSSLVALQWPIYGAGVLGFLATVTNAIPLAYSAALSSLFYVWVALRLVSRNGRVGFDPWLFGGLVAVFVVSVAINQRTFMFALMLLLGFAAVLFMRRILTLPNIFVAYVGFKFLTVFSGVVLSVRWARDTNMSIVTLFATEFFSAETVATFLNPFHVHQAIRAHASEVLPQFDGFYSPYFGESPGFLGRLVILPQMDIVTSKIVAPSEVKWGELWSVIVAALPDLGQEKSLILSDQIVWNLGLRDPSSIGRPMISAEGELFALGGFIAILAVLPICYFSLNLAYRAIARMTGSRAAAILVFSQLLIHAALTTTILGVVAATTRGPLLLMAILFVFQLIASGRRPRWVKIADRGV